jgi:hypothetical protein
MGSHSYSCPSCHSIVRIKAEAGQVVELEDCEACKQAKGALEDGIAEEVEEELDRYKARSAQNKKR